MPKIIESHLEGGRLRIGIVVSRFNQDVTDQLLSGALEELKKKGVEDRNIEVAKVPGAFEIPLVVQKMATSGQYHGILALGAVVRGETPHFEYISHSVSVGLSGIARETGIPVGFGVLTTETVQQALDRADSSKLNRGGQTALTVLEMANLMTEMK